MRREEALLVELQNLYSSFGYRHYRMASYEAYDFYMEHRQFLADEEILTFTDTDGRLMALKPDITLSMIKQRKPDGNPVEKLYYLETVYRPSKAFGGFREILQMGLEWLGPLGDYGVGEVTALAVASLECMSLDFILDLSMTGFLEGLVKELELTEEEIWKLGQLLAERNFPAVEEHLKEKDPVLCRRFLDVARLYGPVDEVMAKLKPLLVGEQMECTYEQVTRLVNFLKAEKLDRSVRLDLSLYSVSGYYHGLMMKGYIQGVADVVLAGGRYDTLLHRMGKRGGAMGFALYLNALEDLEKERIPDADVLVLYHERTPVELVWQKVMELRREKKTVCARSTPPLTEMFGTIVDLRGERDGAD